MPSRKSSRKEENGCWDGGLAKALDRCAEIIISGVALCADVTFGNVIDACDPLSHNIDDGMSVASSIVDRSKRRSKKKKTKKSTSRSRHSNATKSTFLPSLNSRGYLDLEGRDDCPELLEIEATKGNSKSGAKLPGRNGKSQTRGRDDTRDDGDKRKGRSKSPVKRSKQQVGSWMEQMQAKQQQQQLGEAELPAKQQIKHTPLNPVEPSDRHHENMRSVNGNGC